MTVQVPTRFQVLYANSGRVNRIGNPIQTDGVGDVVENITWAYAASSLRVLAEKSYSDMVGTTSTSYVELYNIAVPISSERVDLVCHYRRDTSNNADIKVEVYNAAKSAVLQTGTDTTGAAEGSISLSLASYPSGGLVVVVVSIKVPTSGTAKLKHLRVLEQPLTVSTLP